MCVCVTWKIGGRDDLMIDSHGYITARKIKQDLRDPMDQKTELMSHWFRADSTSWTKLIHQLDIIEEAKVVETIKPSTQRRKGIAI